jgi:hypothetical protein
VVLRLVVLRLVVLRLLVLRLAMAARQWTERIFLELRVEKRGVRVLVEFLPRKTQLVPSIQFC